MNQTDQTLLEQMRITEFEVEHRKALLLFNQDDVLALQGCRAMIEARLEELVAKFYRLQTSVPEIALLIGDADTLGRLRSAQRRYVLDLFSGVYDLEYVNNRLRIGLVHKRIGVEPKLYLSAIHTLKGLLQDAVRAGLATDAERQAALKALDKLLIFDVTLVFETYIRSLVSEIETAKDKSEQYARSMEEKVRERTRQLEELSRTDPLTGVLNVRHLEEILTTILRSAERRSEPVSAVYLDVDSFKQINDTYGHQRGDEVLRVVGQVLKSVVRAGDCIFRYGGDEFCVILPNCQEGDVPGIFTERLQARLTERLQDVSLSVGVAHTGPDDYVDAATLIGMADQKMYAAKQQLKAAE